MTDAVVKGLSTFQQVLIWVINIFWVYQFIISVTSLIKFKEKPLLIDKKHRFIIALPANNEETVIGNLIKSLKMQDYDKDLFDIYVIADNCTDNTAKIARENGAIVYERFDETKKTKGYALNWFLSKMKVKKDDYDALLVFDADNIVDKNFLNVMNKKLCQGEVLVQGYRDIKNPTDTWVSGGYAIFYWTMNRLYHLARYNMGLSPLINGTAFMVKWDMLIDEGWNTKTLTEDIEFALINISKGVKLGWAKDAIVYDEQPLTFKQSWKQRERWSVRTSSMCKWIFKRFSKSSI
jgi:glycosyltransferase, group 2 family